MMTQNKKPPFLLAILAGMALPLLILLLVWWAWSVMRPVPLIVDRGDGRSFIADLTKPVDETIWRIADFTFESDTILTGWVKENVVQDRSGMSLALKRKQVNYHPYSGAEVQKRGFYQYGRYETVMRAAAGSGTVSSFFTHTNETFGDPHDEIDFEFLGRNTRVVSLNYFNDGMSAGTVEIELPYDAAEEMHLYAFEWLPGSIKWYIDGELIHTENGNRLPIPTTPSRVIFNLWSGSEKLYNWHGEPTFEDGTTAQYLCVSFRGLGDDAGQCSDTWTGTFPEKGENE